jgi:xylulokinase
MPGSAPGAPLVLGLDVGTSECKACLVSAAGEPICTARQVYPTYCPQPLWAEQDPEDWLLALATATRRALGAAGIRQGDIGGIGHGQGPMGHKRNTAEATNPGAP